MTGEPKPAKVTIKLGRPVLTTIVPIINPKKANSIKVKRIANSIGTPNKSKRAKLCPARATLAPILKSNSPAIIKREAPIARIPTNAASSTQACIPIGLTHIAEKVPLWDFKVKEMNKIAVKIIKVIIMIIKPKTEPSSGNLMAFLNEPTSAYSFIPRSHLKPQVKNNLANIICQISC